ncbi:MAG TPA: 4-hydroxythreonine-4-phosphate dehydrogenase PdxA [Porphyromonadaceae bacterium]|jgi:4-hydroxythreonine-4-phosphate dehydrogenase|nr:4-hydroxythreonine-4-phosphate dehydrogenase PdxA [Porphyromonadaceae bacterium]HBK33092.1 4-hydroxythreonine-4-phosphate dehydrogenase PdxA [Porphyromonadaceae bacterium]HBL32627.1 4-hydroxythreonine-4-phosphate dehydrogenase PdxA [Porphyromonadaceae bacterium]HBX20767.1 4-hydroxythreonine-4-phosphate dehydrogenase PdxA [Porphyromonadaceae bacterium]HCM20177.1 4-hydroxythreonine-4-phosphate dehydrogenase PdxA [Porphyromonadaceae bacterium]
MSELLKIGITHGDINGIGYEILLKTFSDIRLTEFFTPIIYGSAKSASYHRKVLNYKPINFYTITKAEDYNDGKLNLINCIKDEIKIDLGSPSPDAGEAAYMALDRASQDLKNGLIDALVTLPIHKDTIQNDHFSFPGHTEFLQERFGKGKKALMMMVCNNLRVALVTAHIPVRDVPDTISKELILEKIRTLQTSLVRDFNLENPRIAVLGLNPHAGENGLLGKEEMDVIIPAVAEAQKQTILCAGPFPSDGFFGSGRFKEFDAILAMYHDQGLIPFKTLAMEAGVNYTAGLDIVRTSPDHGTAYDIAGKGIASDESFRQAIYLALDVIRNRSAYDEAHANPLRKMFFDRSKDDEKLDLTKEEQED